MWHSVEEPILNEHNAADDFFHSNFWRLPEAPWREKHCKGSSAWFSVTRPEKEWCVLTPLRGQFMSWKLRAIATPCKCRCLEGMLLALLHSFCLAAWNFLSALDRSFQRCQSLWRGSVLAEPHISDYPACFPTSRSKQKAFMIDSLPWSSE